MIGAGCISSRARFCLHNISVYMFMECLSSRAHILRFAWYVSAPGLVWPAKNVIIIISVIIIMMFIIMITNIYFAIIMIIIAIII